MYKKVKQYLLGCGGGDLLFDLLLLISCLLGDLDRLLTLSLACALVSEPGFCN